MVRIPIRSEHAGAAVTGSIVKIASAGQRSAYSVALSLCVELAAVDMEGNPVTRHHSDVLLRGRALHESRLDRTGRVHFDGIDAENSVLTLRGLDQDTRERAG
jgi:hypothetical protein